MNQYPPPGGSKPADAPPQDGYAGAPPPYGYPPPPDQGAFGQAPPPPPPFAPSQHSGAVPQPPPQQPGGFATPQPPPVYGAQPAYGSFGQPPQQGGDFGHVAPPPYGSPPANAGAPGSVNVYAPPTAQGGQFQGGIGGGQYFPITQPHPKAMPAMIMAIIGWMGCGLLSPFAWYYGATARREIRANPQVYSGESEATAGMWLGAVHTCFFMFAIVIGVVFAIVGALAN